MTIHQTAARQLRSLATSFEFIYASESDESQSGTFRAEDQSQRDRLRLTCDFAANGTKVSRATRLLTVIHKKVSFDFDFVFVYTFWMRSLKKNVENIEFT